MSSNIIGLLPKEYYNPNEKVRKTSGDLDGTKKSLVFTIGTVVKESKTDMVDKKGKKNIRWLRKPSNPLFHQKKLTKFKK